MNILPVDLASRLAAVLAIDPAAKALEYEDTWWTWGDLAEVSEAVEAEVEAAGTTDGSSPVLLVRNRPAVAAVLLGRLSRGAGFFSVNALYPETVLADDLESLAPRVVVGSAGDLRRRGVADALEQIGVTAVFLPDGPSDGVEVVRGTRRPGRQPVLLPPGTAVSISSSGTTGKAKRVLIRHEQLLATVLEAQEHAGIDTAPTARLHGGVSVMTAPFAHIGGLFGLLMTATKGRPAALMDRFEAQQWAALIARHQVIAGSLPPAALRSVLDAGIPKEQLASLRVMSSGTAPLPIDLAVRFEQTYEVPVVQAYGATEFAGGLTSLTVADHRQWGSAKRGSVGRAHPGVELRVVEPDGGGDLAPGVTGVLLVRTGHTVSGADADGWTRTNDLASIDSDGFLYIHGRLDDVIIRGGFKVDLNDVERVLASHPAVREAAVVAAPDERLGQVPVAAVVARAGSAIPTDEELKAHVRLQMPPYAVPAAIAIVDELPRNPTLKVIRPAVLELVRDAGNLRS